MEFTSSEPSSGRELSQPSNTISLSYTAGHIIMERIKVFMKWLRLCNRSGLRLTKEISFMFVQTRESET